MAKLKNKKSLFAIGALSALIVLVGGIVAYNQDLFGFNNNFELGVFKTEVSEIFDSPTAWKPCDETQKLVTVKNTGTIGVEVRIKMDEFWESKDGEELPLIKDGVTLATKALANDDWELRDGYYYLKHTLAKGASEDFLRSVTFNCAADFGENVMVGGSSNSGTTTNEYNGAKYHLKITAQMMQSDDEISWDDTFGEYKQPESFAALRNGFNARWKDDILQDRELAAFKRSKVLPNAASVSNMTEIQGNGETTPVYMWYNTSDKTMYWYSMADAVTWSVDDSVGGWFTCSSIFPTKPNDISGFEYFDMHSLTSLNGLFIGNCLPDDMSAISHWDVSGVTSMGGTFMSDFKPNLFSAVEHWNVSGVRYLSGAFQGNSHITNFSFLKNWRPENMQGIQGAFMNMPNLTSLSGLENWNMPAVTGMDSAFAGCSSLSDISAIKNWNVSSSADIREMFTGPNYTEDSYPVWYTAGRRE